MVTWNHQVQIPSPPSHHGASDAGRPRGYRILDYYRESSFVIERKVFFFEKDRKSHWFVMRQRNYDILMKHENVQQSNPTFRSLSFCLLEIIFLFPRGSDDWWVMSVILIFYYWYGKLAAWNQRLLPHSLGYGSLPHLLIILRWIVCSLSLAASLPPTVSLCCCSHWRGCCSMRPLLRWGRWNGMARGIG